MQQILVYADSLSWGIVPGTRERLPFDQRWPGVLEAGLLAAGERVRVIEDCLNGRRTVWGDPFKPGRNGLEGIGQRVEVNSPLSLAILLLGVNDFQATHQNTPAMSAQGIAALVAAIRSAPIEPGMPTPEVLVVCPPPMGEPSGPIAAKFSGARERSGGLAMHYQEVATSLGCGWFDSGSVIGSSKVDGVHLDAPDHAKLGAALVKPVTDALHKAT